MDVTGARWRTTSQCLRVAGRAKNRAFAETPVEPATSGSKLLPLPAIRKLKSKPPAWALPWHPMQPPMLADLPS